MNNSCNLQQIFVSNVLSNLYVIEQHCAGLSTSSPLNSDNEL